MAVRSHQDSTAVTQATIKPAMVAVMAVREADRGPTSDEDIASRKRHNRPALKQFFSTGMLQTSR